jgi:hypothetical protein
MEGEEVCFEKWGDEVGGVVRFAAGLSTFQKLTTLGGFITPSAIYTHYDIPS